MILRWFVIANQLCKTKRSSTSAAVFLSVSSNKSNSKANMQDENWQIHWWNWWEINLKQILRYTARWGFTKGCVWLSSSTSGNFHPHPNTHRFHLQHGQCLHHPLGHAHPPVSTAQCDIFCCWTSLPPLPRLHHVNLHLHHLLGDHQPGAPLARPLAVHRTCQCPLPWPPPGEHNFYPDNLFFVQAPVPEVVLLPIGVPAPGMGDCQP